MRPRRPTHGWTPLGTRLRRAALAALTALALAPAAVLPAHSATSDEGAPSAVATRPEVLGSAPDADASGLDVRIDDLSPRVLTTQDRVVVSGTVTNTTGAPLEDPVHVEVHLQSVSPVSQDQITGFLSGTQLAGALVASTTLDTPPAPGASVPFSLDLETSALPLGDTFEWGPRGLSVDAGSGTASGGDRTFLVWDSGYEVAPTRIGTLVPWTSASATDSSSETSTALALAGTPGVTLAVDPEVLTGLDREESGEEEQSGHLPGLPTPTASPSSTSPSPSTSSTQAPAAGEPTTPPSGATHPAPPSSTADASPTGSAPASPTPGPTGSTTPTPGGGTPASGGTSGGTSGTGRTSFSRTFLDRAEEVVALPSWDADLAALSMSDSTNLLDLASGSRSTGLRGGSATVVRDVVWPTPDTFGLQALQAFPGQTFVAPPGTLAPTGEYAFTSVTRVEVDPGTGQNSLTGAADSTVTVLSSQAALSDLLSWDPTSPADRLDSEQVLTALSAVITRELPNQSRTLFAPTARGIALDPGLESRLHALLGQRWVEPQTFTQVTESEPTDLERQPVPDAPALDDVTSRAFTEISAALTSTSALAEAIPEPRELLDRLEGAALETLSATGDSEERARRLASFQDMVDSLLTSVRAEPSATVNLINKSANFPVRVTNNLPWDVEVAVTLVPSDPRLRVTAPQTTTIPARSTASVDVPVSAIGSGDITVGYRVTTTGGKVLDDTQSVTVRMRAGWEDAGTAVVAGLLVVMLVAGVTRTVRRRLRDRSASEED